MPQVDRLAVRVGTLLSKTGAPRTLQNEWGSPLHLNSQRGKLKAGLPFVLGGEECLRTRQGGIGVKVGSFGALDREVIRAAKLSVQFADQPSVVADHAFTTGRIAADSFERVLSPMRTAAGLGAKGLRRAPEGLPEAKCCATAQISDDFQHEQATAFVKGKGLVVLMSCGHDGMVNSVRVALKVSGVDRVHAILGDKVVRSSTGTRLVFGG